MTCADFENLVDSVIGTPYRVRGMSTAGFDCLGLVLFLLREGFGVDLAYPAGPGIEKRVRAFFARFRKVESPEPGDVLYYADLEGYSHVALVEDAQWCVETGDWCDTRRREFRDLPGYVIWRVV